MRSDGARELGRPRVSPRWRLLLGLAFALAAPPVLLTLRRSFESDPGSAPFLLYGLVVLVAAWIGGQAAGLAAVPSFLLTLYLMLPAQWRPMTVALALAEGGLLAWFGASRVRALAGWAGLRQELEERIAARTSQLAAANLRLQQEVAAHEHAIENLIAATDQLTASNRELEIFASAASHDLQEPLRKIRTFSDRLLNRHAVGVSEAARDDLVRISSAAQRMSGLIEDLLAYARLSRQPAAAKPVELGEVARGVLSDLALQIEGSAAQVEIGPLPAVEADGAQMRQLLQNLISNALKFVAPGESPEVRVHAEIDRGATPPICRLFVADRGIGLDPRYADRIFDMFQRLHERGRYEGSGIGLAVCRKIVERHGGSIRVASRVGQGSTFVVTLPLAQQPPAAPAGREGEGR